MNCEIVSVGTELLLGDILNTDAKYLAEELSILGISVYYQSVVGDNEERLTETAKQAIDRSDIVIFSGGLGPTSDDITKETVASVLGLPLKLHEESLERMKNFFKNRTMPKINEKQAMMPEDAHVLKNLNGTAPGFLYDNDGKIVIVLPGPPKELTTMFENFVKPYLMKKTDGVLKSKFLKLFGVGESMAAEKIKDLIDNQTNPTIAPYAKDTEALFRITAKAKDDKEAESLLQKTEEQIREVFGSDLYGTDDDTLENVTVDLLIKNNLKIATAESCTAGLIASKIGSVSGASAILEQSYVTYANSAKINLLGVNEDTLKEYGAVSEKTASEMARGVREVSGADIGVSATGIAGPDGGTDEKPVGLVYIGLSTPDKEEVYKLNLNYDRNKNREMTAKHALNFVRKYILEKENTK